MNRRSARAGAPSSGPKAQTGAPFAWVLGVGVLCVWLGWEVVKTPVVERTPPAIAIRLAPSSPEVLRRAAEGELTAGRIDNAKALANESLARAAFNARALRVRGLAEAKAGNLDAADQMLTLAGNWSLRDDPAHAWLVEYRLRRGDFSSSFAHADTLARRRFDLHPQIFNLFTVAATTDARAIGPLASLLGERPLWRAAFLTYLRDRGDTTQLMANLAVTLEQTDAPLTDAEAADIYSFWIHQRRFIAVDAVRRRLNRPPLSDLLQNGEFAETPTRAIAPFTWRTGAEAGAVVQILEDDLRPGNEALRAEYEGYASPVLIEQLVMLAPGRYRLSGEQRKEPGAGEGRLNWVVTCFEGGSDLLGYSPDPSRVGNAWSAFSADFEVPRSGCSAQWIRLMPAAADRSARQVMWFDKFDVTEP